MDDCLNNFHRLTFRSRLHNAWHRCILNITGVRYTLKLLHFTYRNVRVLRHFQRCREIETAVTQRKKTYFPYLDFYKRTWQQSRKLFTPVRTASTAVSQTGTPDQHYLQPLWHATDIEKELPTLSWSSEPSDWTDAPTRAPVSMSKQGAQQEADSSVAGVIEDEGHIVVQNSSKARVHREKTLRPIASLLQPHSLSVHRASYSCNHYSHTATQAKRKQRSLWTAFKRGILGIWQTPYFLLWKLGTVFRTRIFKVKLRSLYQRQQIELLRARQRIITSTQAALFLSVANTIDLYTTRELATLCQHVSRARRKRKMTEEDFACFDQSVTELDNNHETLRYAA